MIKLILVAAGECDEGSDESDVEPEPEPELREGVPPTTRRP